MGSCKGWPNTSIRLALARKKSSMAGSDGHQEHVDIVCSRLGSDLGHKSRGGPLRTDSTNWRTTAQGRECPAHQSLVRHAATDRFPPRVADALRSDRVRLRPIADVGTGFIKCLLPMITRLRISGTKIQPNPSHKGRTAPRSARSRGGHRCPTHEACPRGCEAGA